MAADYKAYGMTLMDRLQSLYNEYGYYLDALDSFTLKGKEGLEKISFMMNDLRVSNSPFNDTKQVIDYKQAVKAEEGFGFLPTSNVLKYILSDGTWIAVRPSGTEPKIKVYYSVRGKNSEEAKSKLIDLQNIIKSKLGL